MNKMQVRHWQPEDIPEVFLLMHQLAVFEEYEDSFKVSHESLERQGFGETPAFQCLVATEIDSKKIIGILVYMLIPYTASTKSILYIKELMIDASARGNGAGKALMQQAAKEAKAADCIGMRWTVANWNEAAKKFYESLGATGNPVWVEYGISGDNFATLAGAG